jgi:hypothetical protein
MATIPGEKKQSRITSGSVDFGFVSYSSAKTIDARVARTITIATIKLKIRNALLMFFRLAIIDRSSRSYPGTS